MKVMQLLDLVSSDASHTQCPPRHRLTIDFVGATQKRHVSIEASRVKLQPGWQVLLEGVLQLASCQATVFHNQSVQHPQAPKFCWQLPSATHNIMGCGGVKMSLSTSVPKGIVPLSSMLCLRVLTLGHDTCGTCDECVMHVNATETRRFSNL